MKQQLIGLCVLGLVGCSGSDPESLIRDRQLDYQAAYVEPTLTVPDTLSDRRISETLVIPGVDEPAAGLYGGSFEAPRADSAMRVTERPTMRQYRVGEVQWLSIPEAPSAVYPELAQFLGLQGLAVATSEQVGTLQRVQSLPFENIDGAFNGLLGDGLGAEAGPVVLSLTVQTGLRAGTTEARVELTAADAPLSNGEAIESVLAALKAHLEGRSGGTRTVSRALNLLEVDQRMQLIRVDGADQLVIAASRPRVFGVTVDALVDLRALVERNDRETGEINLKYVRKSTERRLAGLSFLNRALATSIEDPVGNYQVLIEAADAGVVVKVVPKGAAATIGGANELVRELRARLY